MKRLTLLVLALWVGRWAARAAAALAGSRWLEHRPNNLDHARRPGWMPGPFE